MTKHQHCLTRQQRRRTVTIAPTLMPVYELVCRYYGVKDDASTVFNLCLHTVGKALLDKVKQEESQHVDN